MRVRVYWFRVEALRWGFGLEAQHSSSLEAHSLDLDPECLRNHQQGGVDSVQARAILSFGQDRKFLNPPNRSWPILVFTGLIRITKIKTRWGFGTFYTFAYWV